MKFLSGQHSAVPRTQRFDVHKAPSTASRWSASSISLPAGLKVVCLAALLAALAGCKKEDRQSIEVAGPTAQATANVAATETTPSYRKAGLSYEVFWDRGDHICSLAINMDSMAGAMAMYEAQSGRRVVSFRPFSDGVIAELNSGWEEVLWYKEIDCKDRKSVV